MPRILSRVDKGEVVRILKELREYKRMEEIAVALNRSTVSIWKWLKTDNSKVPCYGDMEQLRILLSKAKRDTL